jgi:hypothetical protein
MTAQQKYSSTNYRFELLTSFEQAVKYKSDWDALVKEMPSVSPCITYEWLSTWWHCLNDDRKELQIVVMKNHDKVIAIAPLMIIKFRFLFLKIRKIEFISMARYADSPSNIAAALDFIIPQNHSGIFPLLFDYIKENCNWHFMRFNPIDSDSPTMLYIGKAAIDSGLLYHAHIVFHNVILNITESWSEYYKSLSKNFRKHLCSTEKKLRQSEAISIEMYTTKDDIHSHMPVLLDIERKSWKWNVGISINSTVFKNFFNEIINTCGDAGMLQLWLLRAGDQYIAYDYNLIYKNSIVNLKGSYDSNYHSFSPGNILLAKEIEQAFEQKIDSINMMWGMTTTKKRWLPETKHSFEVFIFKNDIFVRLLMYTKIRLNFYSFERLFIEYRDRLFRKFKIRSERSELTRMDQINNQ